MKAARQETFARRKRMEVIVSQLVSGTRQHPSHGANRWKALEKRVFLATC